MTGGDFGNESVIHRISENVSEGTAFSIEVEPELLGSGEHAGELCSLPFFKSAAAAKKRFDTLNARFKRRCNRADADIGMHHEIAADGFSDRRRVVFHLWVPRDAN